MNRLIITLLVLLSLYSCQKEVNGSSDGAGSGSGTTSGQKPKLGTVWTYRYYTYNTFNGGLATSDTLIYKATAEETLGGETWLTIKDIDADTLVYYLKERTDGLYQYVNNAPNLICKNPAAVNDTYSSFYSGEIEDFIVKGVKDTIATDIGDIPMNYYETHYNGHLIDQIWFNTNAWIVWKQVNRKIFPQSISYNKYSTLYLKKIDY
ncbi:MAG: hypothetical protein JST86_01135 [Bacteroidetes bacterium]|nr:hypothetical protein [Bacteroidota bacterium]